MKERNPISSAALLPRRRARAGLPPIHHPPTDTFCLFTPGSEGLKDTVRVSNAKRTIPPLPIRTAITNAWPDAAPGAAAAPGVPPRRLPGSSPGATRRRKAPPASPPGLTATGGGTRALHPQTATATHPSCASRPGKPVRSFPNIFCIHLVNKFYILLIGSADGLSTRRGGGGRLPVPALQPLRATRRVRSAPARPASNEEIFYFGGFFIT